MSLPGPVLLALGALASGVVIGWTSTTMRVKFHGETRASATEAVDAWGAASGSHSSGKSESAKASTGPKISGVLNSDPSSLSRRISATSPDFARIIHSAAAIKDFTDRAVRLREIARSIPVEDLPEAYEKAKKFTRSDRYQLLPALGDRWAEADPRGAAEFAFKFEDSGENGGNNLLLDGVMDTWSKAAPAEAASWAEALPPGNARRNALWEVISNEAKKDPQEALQIVQRQSLSGDSRSFAFGVFNQWAAHDLNAAAAAAAQLKGSMADGALQAVARFWGGEDPVKAIAWVSAIPDVATRKSLISNVADEWADSDPRAELAWARGLPDEAMRRQEMTAGIGALAGTDVSAALEQVHAMPSGKDRDDAIQAAALKIAGSDARGAAQLLQELPAGPSRSQAMGQLCGIWAESEPRAALDWLMQNSGSTSGGFFVGMGRTVQNWAANAPDEAISWAKALPPGDNRDSALASIVNGLTATAFDRAQTLFNEISPQAQKSAASSLANTLLQQDTDKGRAWAESLPPGAAQNNALGAVAWQLASQDPVAATQWLGTLTPGKALDSAVSSFSNATFNRDPEGALAWALTIGDPRDRENQMENLATRWLRNDSTAARAWLDANQQITPEEKDRILHHK